MDRNVNWTDNASCTAHTNTSEAHFLTSQIWMNELNDSIKGTGIEIIELDSENSPKTQEQDPYENIQNLNHAWSYANANRFQQLENKFRANRQARLQRRLRNRNNSTANESSENEFDDSFYFNTDSPEDFVTLNQQTDCFTIFDKHSVLQLDSSLESSEDGDMEDTRCDDELEQECNGDAQCEEIVTFNNSEQHGEKRTIWIYSFKNRRILSENDFELVNIPSQSFSCTDSTSCSPECIDEEMISEKITRVGRVASPIPKTYIPRLDLSLAATLPNVTEISEPKSSQTLAGSKETTPITQKPINGWFSVNTKKCEAVSMQDQSTNSINWMALSPRERRRHSHLDTKNMAQLLPVSDIIPHSEKSQDIERIEIEITEEGVISKAPSQSNLKERTTINQIEVKNKKSTMEGRGDYNKCVQRPHIKIDHKPSTAPAPITEPIEKLDSQNWIAEFETPPHMNNEVMEHKDDQQASGEFDLSPAGDRLMVRNMALLKPAGWREYSPIAGSRLSIQLSLGSDSDAEKSLLQRCVSCFKCCKYRFQ